MIMVFVALAVLVVCFDDIGEEYGMMGRSIARYMRLNYLIEPLKEPKYLWQVWRVIVWNFQGEV